MKAKPVVLALHPTIAAGLHRFKEDSPGQCAEGDVRIFRYTQAMLFGARLSNF